MTTIINCTPHDIHLYLQDGFIIAIESTCIARAAQTNKTVDELAIEGSTILLVIPEYGEVVDLPEPAEDTLYLVSALTAAAAPNRKDLIGTTDLVRDDQGRIIGCKALIAFNQ